MNDMSATIVAKSDQINAADLIGKPRTVTVREVRIKGDEEQPVSILIEGDNKAFRPCKGVRRLIVAMWGPDANKYIGQSMTLYCDPDVTWAGKKEGGIRVSHMTGIKGETVFSMRISRAATKPYKILPLANAPTPSTEDPARKWAIAYIAAVNGADDLEALNEIANSKAKRLAELADKRPDLHTECVHALDNRRSALATDWQQGPADEQRGEAFAGDWAE